MLKDVFGSHDFAYCGFGGDLMMCQKIRELTIKRAREVRRKMKHPAQWRIHVWESAGWHLKLRCGVVSIHEDRGDLGFFVSATLGGLNLPYSGRTFSDANEAFEDFMTEYDKHVWQTKKMYARLLKALK